MPRKRRCFLKRFVEALQGQLIWDLRDYGPYEIINIYEDGWGMYVHVMISNKPYTVAYDLNEFRVPPYIFVCVKDGFYRNRKDLLMIDRVSHFDIIRLKEQFHLDAVENYESALVYSDFNHMGYLLRECGGYSAAKAMMDHTDTLELYTLAYYGRLDLALESLVLDDRYKTLFTPRDRDICRWRLNPYLQNSQPYDNLAFDT